MALHRRNPRRDGNENEIILALRQFGVSVTRLSQKGVPDLLLGYQGRLALAEVKSKRGKLTQDQRDWQCGWMGPPILILRSVDDVVAWIRGGADPR